MKYQIIAKGAIYYVTISAVIFSRVKISICFRAKAHLVFHWCLYNMLFSLLEAEDDYDESPILLKKIANYRNDTQFNL